MVALVADRRLVTEQVRGLNEETSPLDLNTSFARRDLQEELARSLVNEAESSLQSKTGPTISLSSLSRSEKGTTKGTELSAQAGALARAELAPELGIQEAEWVALQVEDLARFREPGLLAQAIEKIGESEPAPETAATPPGHIKERIVLGPNTDPWNGVNPQNPFSLLLREMEAANGNDLGTNATAELTFSELSAPQTGLSIRNGAQRELMMARKAQAELVLSA